MSIAAGVHRISAGLLRFHGMPSPGLPRSSTLQRGPIPMGTDQPRPLSSSMGAAQKRLRRPGSGQSSGWRAAPGGPATSTRSWFSDQIARASSGRGAFRAFSAGGPGASIKTTPRAPSGWCTSRLAAVARDGAHSVAVADDQQVESGHNRLERGRPIRTFEGKDFRHDRRRGLRMRALVQAREIGPHAK